MPRFYPLCSFSSLTLLVDLLHHLTVSIEKTRFNFHFFHRSPSTFLLHFIDEELAWVSADIINEVRRGHYEIYIDDEDYSDALPRTKVITLKSLGPGLDALPMQNEDIDDTGVEDMAKLNFLHEASVLDNLRRRFRSTLPYTYTGDICIATNPYQWLDIYTIELMEEHKEFLRHTLAPHVYATSAAAYRGVRDFGRNQSILVSGESGE